MVSRVTIKPQAFPLDGFKYINETKKLREKTQLIRKLFVPVNSY